MSKRTFPAEGKFRYFKGRNGARDVCVIATIPHGKATRDVQVPLDPEQIVRLAEAIQCCPHQIGEVVPVATNEDGTIRYERREYVNLGHAIWHLDNPGMPRPCLPHSGTVIDVADETKLPPGPAIDVQAADALTGYTITDEQIRELRNTKLSVDHWNLCDSALRNQSEWDRVARSRCAALINARTVAP